MSRRATSWVVALALLAAVGGSVVTGWVIWSARIAADVAVTWSPDSPRCAGTTVKQTRSGRAVIEASRTMRCVITIQVSNGSGHGVHADQAVAPFVGPHTGTVVTAANAQPDSRGGRYAIDARLPIDRDVAAGDSISFDIDLVFRPAGCNDSGTFWAANWPTVTIDVLGRSFDRHAESTYSFHRDGRTPGCRRM